MLGDRFYELIRFRQTEDLVDVQFFAQETHYCVGQKNQGVLSFMALKEKGKATRQLAFQGGCVFKT